MFYHNFKCSLKILLKNKGLVFWTFVFPIILGIFFNMAFSDMEIIAQVQKQNIAGIKVLENNGFSKKIENKNYKYYKIK